MQNEIMKDNRFHEDYIRIGKNIRHYRKQMGFTQEQLADLIFISRGSSAKSKARRIRHIPPSICF